MPVGYGELWIDLEEEEVELARLIVAPTARGRGYGAALTESLLARAHALFDDVFLRVRPDNDRAQRLYERIGFERVASDLAQAWNAQQPVDYVWMQAPSH